MDAREGFSKDSITPNSSPATRTAAPPRSSPLCHEPESGETAEGVGPDELTGAPPEDFLGVLAPLAAQSGKTAGCFWPSSCSWDKQSRCSCI